MDSPRPIRIGEGAGFAAAWVEPAVDLAARGDLDYLTFECLGERTVALAQLARLRDPAAGYDPLLVRRMRGVLQPCFSRGTRIVTNAGAANPLAAGERVVEIARTLGLRGLRVAVVTGDDVLDRLDRDALTLEETGQPLRLVGDRLVSANAYLGAAPLLDALHQGAHVVVAGRVSDPALVLAALRHAFEWPADAWDLVGAGVAVGHLLECGPQVTGGYFADPPFKTVPDIAAIGYPIAECHPDGTATITKLPGTGGVVTVATCTEQILYEVHDPSRYLQPDVTADFSAVEFLPEGPDRVRVRGARGRPAPSTLKVSVGYRDGFVGEGQISYGGAGCVTRARLAAEAVTARLASQGVRWRELRADLIGWDSLAVPPAARIPEPPEVRLRIVARVDTREEAEAVGIEVEGLYVAGPAGGGGVTRSVREALSLGSVLVPREIVRPEVVVLEV
ncbi:MAG TPA: acyclic terpene utilization AtuA family protein [Chloroflexota bacterium]